MIAGVQSDFKTKKLEQLSCYIKGHLSSWVAILRVLWAAVSLERLKRVKKRRTRICKIANTQIRIQKKWNVISLLFLRFIQWFLHCRTRLELSSLMMYFESHNSLALWRYSFLLFLDVPIERFEMSLLITRLILRVLPSKVHHRTRRETSSSVIYKYWWLLASINFSSREVAAIFSVNCSRI